jgi:hypothetical protein
MEKTQTFSRPRVRFARTAQCLYFSYTRARSVSFAAEPEIIPCRALPRVQFSPEPELIPRSSHDRRAHFATVVQYITPHQPPRRAVSFTAEPEIAPVRTPSRVHFSPEPEMIPRSSHCRKARFSEKIQYIPPTPAVQITREYDYLKRQTQCLFYMMATIFNMMLRAISMLLEVTRTQLKGLNHPVDLKTTNEPSTLDILSALDSSHDGHQLTQTEVLLNHHTTANTTSNCFNSMKDRKRRLELLMEMEKCSGQTFEPIEAVEIQNHRRKRIKFAEKDDVKIIPVEEVTICEYDLEARKT